MSLVWSLLLSTLFIGFLLEEHLTLGSSLLLGEVDVTRCRENERQALLIFKRSLVDDSGILSSWGNGDDRKDCCIWRGVVCSNRTGHVLMLNLQPTYGYLGGTISPSLLDLSHLNYLDLSFNTFNGSNIPEFIGSLRNLRYLGLSHAAFSGPIPYQLGNLSRLLSLDLSGNDLYSGRNLNWLSHLSSLKNLDLSFSNLSKANDWVQVVNKLPYLESLSLQSCNLPNIISPSLSLVNSSTALTSLELFGNNLTSPVIYPWLFNVSSNLVYLDLSLNQLKGSIPEAFGNMSALKQLSLFSNQLEGGIPKSFRNMFSLESLLLHHNSLSGDFTEYTQNLSGCTEHSLKILVLDNNQITGSIPDQMARFSLLTDLSLGNNRLHGTISEGIGHLSELEILDLHGNSLKATIGFFPFRLSFIRLGSCKSGPRFPKWIQSQNNFAELDISAAEISDTIPLWFWDLSPSLRYLNLSYNQISGILPDLSLKFVSFPGLDLRSNLLDGPLPLFPSKLTSLNLSKNRFSGSISSLCRITGEALQFLDLSENLLSGTVPNCFQQWPYLQVLNLANNNFSGRLPSSIGSLVSLVMFNLHNNSFSGELPSSLNNCTEVKFMDLSDNRLSGEIPAWMGQSLTSLVFLSLQANKFNGSTPYHLCQLAYIQILDLSRNKLSGGIPECINSLTSMARKGNLSTTIQQNYVYGDPQFGDIGPYIDKALLVWKGREYEYTKNLGLLIVIDLSSNELSGEIPGEIARLSGLVALNLSWNILTGVIPQKIGQLRQLEVLDLSRNRLSGEIPTSLAELTFLSHLDLSYNNLSGKIPLSTQLQNFDASAFANNLALCGPPVSSSCSAAETQQLQPRNINQEDEDELGKWFLAGMGVGFVVSFGGLCSALLLKHSWRLAYFHLLDNLMDWLNVRFGAQKPRSKRKIQSLELP
ncbi:PREDICTED: probable LRR receptor-like serine/threonine-protein kinase At4g36180 [Theobroma cacao]|uniref:Probable LRR receptor-like serine/threonine-protein kinase At4g36180 n=1 Tax=Theobroma cacao TaxID=3641 RepID=A0AB32W122_THECC|nr:PREDICTED: probable LRR receptor-like serine/threonine-protein kinase At4g36180 [Theobroma cacao]